MNNKCKVILIGVAVLAVVAIGYLFYIKYQESKLGPVSYESFKKIEENGKVFLENKEVGLKFQVPEGWKTDDVFGWTSLSMQSSDYKVFNEKNYPIPEKGCWIDILAKKEFSGKEDVEYLDVLDLLKDKEYMNSQNSEKNIYELFFLDSLESIKSKTIINQNKENQGEVVSIELPYDKKYYSFETYLFGSDKEKCLEEFNDFIQTISIKK